MQRVTFDANVALAGFVVALGCAFRRRSSCEGVEVKSTRAKARSQMLEGVSHYVWVYFNSLNFIEVFTPLCGVIR